jgi:hypothetical protein
MLETEGREFATKKEVAARYRHSHRSVDTWMKKYGMPYIKIGKSVRFDIRVTDEWFRTFKGN